MQIGEKERQRQKGNAHKSPAEAMADSSGRLPKRINKRYKQKIRPRERKEGKMSQEMKPSDNEAQARTDPSDK